MVWVCVRYVAHLTYTTNVSNYSEAKELIDKLILNMYCSHQAAKAMVAFGLVILVRLYRGH